MEDSFGQDKNTASSLFSKMDPDAISEKPKEDSAEGRAFRSQGLEEFLDNLAVLDQSVIVKEEKQQAVEKANKKAKNMGARIMNKMLGRSSNKAEKITVQSATQPQLSASEPLAEKFKEVQEASDEDDIIQPSPYADPLRYRLQPRREQANLNRNAIISSNPESAVSGITIARNRGEAHLALFGPVENPDDTNTTTSLRANSFRNTPSRIRSSDVESINFQEPIAFDPDEMSLAPPQGDMASSAPMTYEEQVHQYQQQELQYVVKTVAQDLSCRATWKQYMESYSRGHFNLINPPPPPPLNSTFEYLPAVFPPGESNRMKMSREYDILWPQWGQEKAGDLIRLAMKQFQTKYVSLSFFDEHYEIFKAENGYNVSHVDRTVSFAAHCLLSKDVLVILDTREDWRFTKNPLVVEKPKIRFWAGAPMMSPCGEVLGVFAIFATKPRSSFTPVERRELAEFTALVMKDLKLQVDALTILRQRSTPILDRESLINAPYRAQSINSIVGLSGIDSNLVPPALSYHKGKTPKPKQSRVFIDRASQDALLHPSEQTPPSSAESSSGYFDTPSSLMTNHDQASGQFGIIRGQYFHNSMASYPSGIRVSSPRPFSSSDLTSLHPHPPNTPVQPVREADLSTRPKFDLDWNDFKNLTDEDCAEPYPQSASVAPRVIRRTRSDRFTGNSSMKPRFSHLESIASLAEYQQDFGMDGSGNEDSYNYRRNVGYEGDKVLTRQRSQNSGMSSSRSSRTSAAETSVGKYLNVPLARVSSNTTSARNRAREVDNSPLIDLTTPPDSEETSLQTKEQRMIVYKKSATLRPNRISSNAPTVESTFSLSNETKIEAARACSFHAQKLGYDLVYAVEIKPVRQFMSDEEILAPNGLKMKTLAAFGLNHTLNMTPSTHIRALRARGGEHWSDPAGTRYQEGDYQSGYLIPIHSEGGPRAKRSSGIILGVFRKPRRVMTGEIPSAAAEMERLVAFGQVLISIFRGKDRKQTRSNTESAFPANEAQELVLKTHSFDISRSRPY
ncbi:hypothetical protein DL95DRAFT_456629 [Leptodontidium sp. 2 PMI_412]|nr:hypothetical protein DL95DRAFT_456629 [Leptodontidium sp. 2 PMI_412]